MKPQKKSVNISSYFHTSVQSNDSARQFPSMQAWRTSTSNSPERAFRPTLSLQIHIEISMIEENPVRKPHQVNFVSIFETSTFEKPSNIDNLVKKARPIGTLMGYETLHKIERPRFGFQYLYRYFNLSFSQSDVPDQPD